MKLSEIGQIQKDKYRIFSHKGSLDLKTNNKQTRSHEHKRRCTWPGDFQDGGLAQERVMRDDCDQITLYTGVQMS